MVTPFKLIFSQKNSHYAVETFVNSEDELYRLDDSLIVKITENISLNLYFNSDNKHDKCYFDLLDIVYKKDFQDDISYVPPSDEPVSIYNTDDDYTGALIPGYYKIMVLSDGTRFYTWIKIIPKQMSEQQWISMRDDIEREATGLAQDVLYKRVGSELNDTSQLPISLLKKLELINKHFKNWPISFKSIYENPNYKIQRKYKAVDKTAAQMIDQISIRKTNVDAKTRARNQVYTVKNVISNNVLENKWLKYLILNISKEVRTIFKELDMHLIYIENKIKQKSKWQNSFKDIEYIKLESAKIEILTYRQTVSSILNDCSNFLNLEWVKNLPSNKPIHYSLTLQADYNYRRILNFYNDLTIKNYEIKLCEKYTYYWKRTDQLYEIWGVLQFIKALSSEELGFEIESGWIFSHLNIQKKQVEVPFLESGEVITLKKDDIILNLVYDQMINSKDSNILFTNNGSKRPDLRLDYFKNGEYLQSIIIDFKYRPLFRIWNPAKRTEVMEQLTSYADNFYSKQIFMYTLPNSWRLLRPVQQVWAVFPNHPDNSYMGKPRNFDLVELTPNLSNDHIKNSLTNALEGINKNWLDISIQN